MSATEEQISRKTAPDKKRPGRPKNPPNTPPKVVIKALVDERIVNDARRIAFKRGESLTAFLSKALYDRVHQNF